MRRALLSVAYAGFGVVFAHAVLLSAQTAMPTADEIVAKNIAAKGGAEKLKAIDSVRITAAASVQNMMTPMVIELKRPNLRRQEVTLNGQKLVQTFDGTNGWLLNPALGDKPMQMPPAQSASMKQDAEFDSPLLDYKAKGVTVAFIGKEDIDGHPAYHLRVTTKEGAVRDYFIDPDTGLVRTGTAITCRIRYVGSFWCTLHAPGRTRVTVPVRRSTAGVAIMHG